MQLGRNVLNDVVKGNVKQKLSGLLHPDLFSVQGIRFKKMEVILAKDMENLGKAGEIVTVAPGYFRNYLMPRLLAVPNLEKFARLVSQQQQQQRLVSQQQQQEEKEGGVAGEEDDTRGEKKMAEYQAAANCLSTARLVLRKFTKAKNEIRIPVTKEELVDEVRRQLRVSIEAENIHLPVPLNVLGEFQVHLRLPRAIPLPEGKSHWILHVKIRRK